ncbi:beta-glucan synthesis-associated [Scheffersomyces xylosifermentans]|uniref:beta-glucan synthesis-associated n=1 Tax=Scheffersomyces xylosifermentans TaxID=1304137 RepID=UPI00315C9A7E
MELLEPKNFDTTEWILTDEEYNNIDNEFPAPPKAFNKNSDYFNPKVYYNNFNLGQFVAVIAVLSVIVFGSLGFLINTAQHYYKTPPPQVYEILSNYKYPTLSAIRTSLIDPDTPKEFLTKKGIRDSAEIWSLVFSDEFNAEGRTFHEGDDQFFTAVDLHYQGTNDLEYYVPHMAETRNGSLHITIDAFQTNGVDYISAMLQSWNKLCFNKNALVEVSLKMPSFSQSRGLWPAVWSLGNLARPGYMATTDGVWPYTYNECDFGITPNQSSPDGISFLPGQRLSKCTCYGQDHPSIGLGRGAPEIDIIEGTHALYDEWALGAQTLQVAPFDPWWRPDYDFLTIENTNITAMKADTGTPQQEAIASTTVLNPNWFGSVRNNSDHNQRFKNNTLFQSYGFEFRSDKTDDRDSYIQFFLADNKTMAIYGDSLHPTENVGWRQISREPMSLIFNLGLSPTWAQIDYGSLEFPATLEIDYIRIYQLSGEEEMTCDPVDYPTFDYINSHANAYMNVNLTSWKEAGYSFPHNSFMNGCQAPTG